MGELKIINGAISGEIAINENSQFNDICADKVIVNKNVIARLYGSVNHITLKKGSKIYLHGKLTGGVKNEGGDIYIFSKDRQTAKPS